MKGLNKFIRGNVPEIVVDYFDLILFTGIFIFLSAKCLQFYMIRRTKENARRKWSSSPKDVVIFHSGPRGNTVPDISPFALKLETFLRMANIPYKFDDEFPFGEKGKTPWITFNGKSLTDSQHIIEFLTKKFDVKLGNYNETERAHGRAARIMVEEHMYWGGVVWRFTYCNPKILWNLYSPFFNKYNYIIRPILWRSVVSKFNAMAWAQGTARHSYEEIVLMMNKSTEALSKILGDKKFILGDEPCDDDAAIFGLMAQGLYASPGAPFHEVFKRCPNLIQYTERMKARFWPDWNELIDAK